MRKPSTHTPLPLIVEAGIMLKQYCRKGEDGMAVYEPGWDDHIIAEKTGANLSTVAKMRLETYGRVMAQRGAEPDLAKDLRRAVDTIERLSLAVSALAHRVSALEERINPQSPLFDTGDVQTRN